MFGSHIGAPNAGVDKKPVGVDASAGFVYCDLEEAFNQGEAAMSFSNSAETLVLDWLLTAGTATRPTSLHLALFTSDPAEDASGTEVTTVGTAYARQTAAFTVTGDTASNTAAIEFPTATATYGTVSHVGVFDAVTAGNLIAYATLTTSKVIDTGDVLRLPISDLSITLD